MSAEVHLPVAVLAGGLATRLHPDTSMTPKAMLEVAGEPFIAHQMRLLARQGYRHVVMCIGFLGEQIVDFLGRGERFGVSVSYSQEPERGLLGTGGALRKALPLLGETFLVLYGDSYLLAPLGPAEARFRASGTLGLMTVLRNEDLWDTSNVIYTEGRVAEYSKRRHNPDMKYIDYGFGGLRREALSGYQDGAVFDLAEVYSHLASSGDLIGHEVFDRFYEIGSPDGLREARSFFMGRQHD